MAASERNVKKMQKRAYLPLVMRSVAAIVLVATVIGVIVYLSRGDANAEFRARGLPASLSKDVIAVVDGYERREVENGVTKYAIRADRATTFTDNHQELENVFLEVFDEESRPSRIKAVKAIYLPGEEKTFKVFFEGDVQVDSADGLKLATAIIVYDHATGVAEADRPIQFTREYVSGNSESATVFVNEKRVELRGAVVIEGSDAVEGVAGTNGPWKMNSSFASYDHGKSLVELRGDVVVQTTSDVLKAGRAVVTLAKVSETAADVSQAELFDGVTIESRDTGGEKRTITANYGKYDKTAGTFDLQGNVVITAPSESGPVKMTAATALYDERAPSARLLGGGTIETPRERISGGEINAQLAPGGKLRSASVINNGKITQNSPERNLDLAATRIDAAFDAAGELARAELKEKATAVVIPANAAGYSKASLAAARSIQIVMDKGLAKTMITDGRTTLVLDPQAGDAASTRRTIRADKINTAFGPDGKTLARAEAIGNSELDIEPVNAGPEIYRTIVAAPRFDCDFFPGRNFARRCDAGRSVRTRRLPTVAREGRGEQVMTSDTATALFRDDSRDVETLTADGNARFTELDRNASAARFVFNAATEVVQLRGGSPTAWDSRARGRAREIDWDVRNQRSKLSGNVSTTYYSQGSTGNSAPFGSVNDPVYITSNTAEIDHRTEVAAFSGNARAWQKDNFVKGGQITIFQKEARFRAETNVESQLYGVKTRGSGGAVPVFANADRMDYDRASSQIVYTGTVRIKQGPEQINAEVGKIFLSKENDIDRAEFEQNVTITQPGRTASGRSAFYFAADERVVLRGDPARVQDPRSGSTQSAEITVFLRDDRAIADGRSETNAAGRNRSVYKVQNPD